MTQQEIRADIARAQAAQTEAVRQVRHEKTAAENNGVSHRESHDTKGVKDAWIDFSEARGAEKALRSLLKDAK